MTITWTISQLERNISTGFVTNAHWRATAIDDGHEASIYSTASWADGTVNIAYDALTPETVLGWVWESIDKQATEDALAANIALQKNPVQASGTPW